MLQPIQNPPGNPGGVDPRNTVPISGAWILVVAALLLGIYLLWRRRKA